MPENSPKKEEEKKEKVTHTVRFVKLQPIKKCG